MKMTYIVSQTEGFSFAYMKEFFLSSMMQWMSAPEPKCMDSIVSDRAKRLREQMSSMVEETKESSSTDADDHD